MIEPETVFAIALAQENENHPDQYQEMAISIISIQHPLIQKIKEVINGIKGHGSK